MTWKMFIDDERFPVDESMIIVRSFEEAIEKININGCPICIYFDHDIGEGQFTGYDLAKWLIEKDLDNNQEFIPEDFTFEIHSQNPVGRENIYGLLNSYLVYKNKEKLEHKKNKI